MRPAAKPRPRTSVRTTRKVASQWDPVTEKAVAGECRAFGAAALLRLPTRLHIIWQDDTTLKLETDAGTQTRLLRFGPPLSKGERSRQGYSAAEWFKQPQSAGLGFGGRGGGFAGET